MISQKGWNVEVVVDGNDFFCYAIKKEIKW